MYILDYCVYGSLTIFISRLKVDTLFQKICSMVTRNFAFRTVFGGSTHLVIQPMCYGTGCMQSYNQSDRTAVIVEGLMEQFFR
jgi:hypothetical protein